MPVQLTEDELVAHLQHSSLPTILVEGPDDIFIYRQMESEFKDKFQADFLPCGGRNTLLAVFKRRAEYAHLKVHFIADKDLWYFVGIPDEYKGICFTNGYSIENDLYTDGGKFLDTLLDEKELELKSQLLETIIEWYTFEVEQFIEKQQEMPFLKMVLLSPNFMEEQGAKMNTDFLKERNFVKPSQKYLESIKARYSEALRGKFIVQIYRKIFEHYRKKSNSKAVVYGG